MRSVHSQYKGGQKKFQSGTGHVNFKNLFECVPNQYLVLNKAFEIIAVSDAYLTANEGKREVILGQSIFNVLPGMSPAEAKNLRDSLERVLANKVPDVVAGAATLESSGPDPEEPRVNHLKYTHIPVFAADHSVQNIIQNIEDAAAPGELRAAQAGESELIKKLTARCIHLEAETIKARQETLATQQNLEAQKAELTKLYSNAKNNLLTSLQNEENLQKANNELAHSNFELEQFAYVASHDLQEPLRKVTNFTGLFVETYGSCVDELGVRYLGKVTDGVKRMTGLIDNLLLYSRIGRQNLNEEKESLNQVLGRAIGDQSDTIALTGAKVTVGALPEVCVPRAEIYQLFSNLISNAIKFRREGTPPEVEVRAIQNGQSDWEFVVRDNGIGIEEEYFDQLFIVFRRLNARASYPGTGIGLAICKKVVDRFGGKIWASSLPGSGTEFHFTLPSIFL